MALLAVAALAMLGACAPADPVADPSIRAAIADLWVERHVWGGMTEQGEFFTTLEIDGDQGWVVSSLDGTTEGRLEPAQLAALVTAIESTGLLEAGGEPLCESSSDGIDVRYSWRAGGEVHSVSSCDVEIPAGDPLVVALERLAERLGASGW